MEEVCLFLVCSSLLCDLHTADLPVLEELCFHVHGTDADHYLPGQGLKCLCSEAAWKGLLAHTCILRPSYNWSDYRNHRDDAGKEELHTHCAGAWSLWIRSKL